MLNYKVHIVHSTRFHFPTNANAIIDDHNDRPTTLEGAGEGSPLPLFKGNFKVTISSYSIQKVLKQEEYER